MKRSFCLLVFVIFLIGCIPQTPVASGITAPTPTNKITPITETAAAPASVPSHWWDKAVFYEIFVRSFYDTNGDGIGDFNGITQKLDYLKQLGITAIWLMPIQPSPTYHGYDVVDYYAVNPQYGSMEDFKNLLTEAHKRDMKVIIDLVLNHTSSQNSWFISANNDPKSPYRDWYVWSDTIPAGSNGGMWHQGKTGYYYGYFDASMPDLNYNNPAVTAEMEKVTKYWLDQGVDGFRIDAAKHLIEEGNKLENTKSTHQWFKQYYTFYKSVNPEVYMVGEVAGSDATQVSLYTGNQLDMIFNFELASGFVNSANGGANSGVNSAIKFVLMDAPSWKFATFLTNHDQNRVMSVLGGNVEKAKVAAALLLTSPGTPFIYYGEEIGMQGVKPDEDIRRPMQWADGANAGFSSGKPWRALDATNLKANVQTELADPNSLLNFYTELIHLREQNPALGGGSLALVQADNPGIYAVFRQNGEQNLLVLINLKGESISNFHLDLAKTGLADGEYTLNPLYGNEKPKNLTITTGGVSGYAPLTSILPYSIYIFQLSHP